MGILAALKPTLGKTLVSILCAVVVALYMGFVGFTGGLVVGTVEAGVNSPGFVVESTAETFEASAEGREANIDASALENAAKRPVEMGFQYATKGFFKTFLWIYGLWSAIQMMGILRKK